MKPTVLELRRKKGARLAMLTAYDFPSARLVAEAGIDLILVGDSLGMVVLGYDSTVPVTMADMVHHTAAARRGSPEAFLIADLPFVSYGTVEQALANSARLMKEARADSVKLEGGVEMVPIVEALVRAGVPGLGHVGLTPQTASALGGGGKDDRRRGRVLGRRSALRPIPRRRSELRHEGRRGETALWQLGDSCAIWWGFSSAWRLRQPQRRAGARRAASRSASRR